MWGAFDPRVRGWRFVPQSRLAAIASIAGVVIVSMIAGGAVVAATYQAQSNEQRETLAAGFERRLDLAKLAMKMVEETVKADQVRMDVGLKSPQDLMDSRIKLASAQAQVKSIELQLAEVRLTGREPLQEISAPVVSGRDFVSERLRVDLSVPEAALEFEKARLKDTQTRVEIGTLPPIDLHWQKAHTAEIEVAIETIRRKLEIRQKFLKGEYDAVQADLRVLETEAELRRKSLAPKVAVAEQEVEAFKARFNVGLITSVELAEARMRLNQLNLDLSKAEVDLAVIRLRLKKKD